MMWGFLKGRYLSRAPFELARKVAGISLGRAVGVLVLNTWFHCALFKTFALFLYTQPPGLTERNYFLVP